MPFRSAFSSLFTQDATIAIVVFALVMCALLGAMAYSSWRRRRGRGPSRRAKANRVELGYAGALVGMMIFLVISSFTANAKDYPDPPKPALAVKVTGFQWCWKFHYEGTPRTQAGQCQGDIPARFPVLVVPVGEPVRLDVTSTDVVHAVWVPHWRLKLYAYPGHVQSLTVTIPRAGKWMSRCAVLCGIYHFEMDFWLRAIPPAAFATFMRTGRI